MHIVPFAPGSGPDARPDPPRAVASRFTPPAAQQNALIYGGHYLSQAGIPIVLSGGALVLCRAPCHGYISCHFEPLSHFAPLCHFERSEKSFPAVHLNPAFPRIMSFRAQREIFSARPDRTQDFSSLRSSK